MEADGTSHVGIHGILVAEEAFDGSFYCRRFGSYHDSRPHYTKYSVSKHSDLEPFQAQRPTW